MNFHLQKEKLIHTNQQSHISRSNNITTFSTHHTRTIYTRCSRHSFFHFFLSANCKDQKFHKITKFLKCAIDELRFDDDYMMMRDDKLANVIFDLILSVATSTTITLFLRILWFDNPL